MSMHDRDWDDGAVADGADGSTQDWPNGLSFGCGRSYALERDASPIRLPDAMWGIVTYQEIEDMYQSDEPGTEDEGETYCPARRGSPEREAAFRQALKGKDRKLAMIARLNQVDGWTRKDIAKKYGVAPSTVTRWCKEIEEFRQQWEQTQDEMPFRNLPARTQRVAQLWFHRNQSADGIARILDIDYQTARQEVIAAVNAYNTAVPTPDVSTVARPKRQDGRHARSEATQQRILSAIPQLSELYGRPPSVREVQRFLDMTSMNAIHPHITVLKQQGRLRTHVSGRGLEVVDTSESVPDTRAKEAY